MLRRVRETAPAGLVPLAWTFAVAAHREVVATRTVLIGHVVMATLLLAFAVLSWREMWAEPVLRAWLAVVGGGFALTAAGATALASGGPAVAIEATVVGWALGPALALAYTGLKSPADEGRTVYLAGGGCSALGALLVAVPGALAGVDATLVGLALAGIGQTAGIVVAALSNV